MTAPSDRPEDEATARTSICPHPECRAQIGDGCTYALAIRDDETGRFLRWDRVARPAHHARIAAATDGRVYRYALRSVNAYIARAPRVELDELYRRGRP